MDAKLQSQVLIESLPYLRKFHGETVVIKYGGHAMKDEALKAAFARNIDRKSTRLNSSHTDISRMPSSA